MIAIRKAEDRGQSRADWLESYHTFSFNEYYDPNHMNFGPLRVINDDVIAPSGGFGMHGHRDMEIITYVLDGELEHRDSLGNGEVLRPGEVQRMTAGTGIRHSEFNPSVEKPVHLLQIWIEPDKRGHTPSYEQKPFAAADRRGKLRLVASKDAREGSVAIHQDAEVYIGDFNSGETASYSIRPGRQVWLHVARGSVTVGKNILKAGDALAVTGESALEFSGGGNGTNSGEVLLFDMA